MAARQNTTRLLLLSFHHAPPTLHFRVANPCPRFRGLQLTPRPYLSQLLQQRRSATFSPCLSASTYLLSLIPHLLLRQRSIHRQVEHQGLKAIDTTGIKVSLTSWRMYHHPSKMLMAGGMVKVLEFLRAQVVVDQLADSLPLGAGVPVLVLVLAQCEDNRQVGQVLFFFGLGLELIVGRSKIKIASTDARFTANWTGSR